jgi:hypothetical protein
MTYFTQCEEYKPEFCDENYIDLVLFDEFDHKIIRDKWFVGYDKDSGRIGKFNFWKHSHESKFCIEFKYL